MVFGMTSRKIDPRGTAEGTGKSMQVATIR